MKINSSTTVACALLLLSAPAGADVIVQEFTDANEWESAVGEFSTINFDTLPGGTPLDDQYAHLGVTFGPWVWEIAGEKAISPEPHGSIQVFFDEPQAWAAFEPGFNLGVRLFSEGKMIYESELGAFGKHDGTPFGGVISSKPFDEMVIYRPTIFGGDGGTTIDALHWGIPAPGSLALLALAGMVGPSRRRGA